MGQTLAGFFRTRKEGETAYSDLIVEGFSIDQVSLVVGDTRCDESPASGPEEGTGVESEIPEDVAKGGALGLAATLVLLVVPGIGPILAAGPLAAALVGAAVGAGTGGSFGFLRDHGISEEEAALYEEGVRGGRALVTVHGVKDEDEERAREIMRRYGAIWTEELKTQPGAGAA